MELELRDEIDERIRIVCSRGHEGSVPEKYAGRKVRCRRCAEVLRVPCAGWSEAEVPQLRSAGSRRSSRRASGYGSVFEGRDKKPLIAGVAALVLVASTGLTMAVSGWRPWATDALNYVPRTMDVVAQVDLDRLRTEVPQVNDWFQELRKKQEKRLGKMVFDPSSIDRVVMAGNMADGGTKQLVFLVEMEGFDIGRLKDAKEAKTRLKLKQRKHRGETYYTFAQKLPTGGTIAAYVVSPTLVALGTEVSVKQVIDIAEGKATSIRKNREIAPLLEGNDGQLFWLAALVDGKAREASRSAAEVESVKVGFDYRSASEMAALTGAAQFATADDASKGAKIVKDALKKLEPKRDAAAKAIPAGMMAKFEGLVSSTSLDTTGRKLEARVDFDVAKIKELLGEADKALTTARK